VLKPAGISPDSAGTVALVAEVPYGETGLILAFIGILFAVGGAHGVLGRVQPGPAPGLEVGQALQAAERAALHALARGLPAARLRDRADGRGPDLAHGVRGDLLDTGAPAHLPADPAGRQRPSGDGQARERAVTRVPGWGYFGLICLLAVAAPVLFVWTNGGG
jgi:hypothetical protein